MMKEKKTMFWKIKDLIIIHLGRNPRRGGRPPRDKNKIIKHIENDKDILEIEEI